MPSAGPALDTQPLGANQSLIGRRLVYGTTRSGEAQEGGRAYRQLRLREEREERHDRHGEVAVALVFQARRAHEQKRRTRALAGVRRQRLHVLRRLRVHCRHPRRRRRRTALSVQEGGGRVDSRGSERVRGGLGLSAGRTGAHDGAALQQVELVLRLTRRHGA